MGAWPPSWPCRSIWAGPSWPSPGRAAGCRCPTSSPPPTACSVLLPSRPSGPRWCCAWDRRGRPRCSTSGWPRWRPRYPRSSWTGGGGGPIRTARPPIWPAPPRPPSWPRCPATGRSRARSPSGSPAGAGGIRRPGPCSTGSSGRAVSWPAPSRPSPRRPCGRCLLAAPWSCRPPCRCATWSGTARRPPACGSSPTGGPTASTGSCPLLWVWPWPILRLRPSPCWAIWRSCTTPAPCCGPRHGPPA